MQDKITINIKIDNSFFGRVEEFKHLGNTLMNQNFISEEIKSRWVRECLLSFGAEFFVTSLLSKNIKLIYTKL
jgi:hypothetical protein